MRSAHFYPDAAKAARLAPAVSQNARRLDGTVQRRGTILWIHPPPSQLRDAVLACTAS